MLTREYLFEPAITCLNRMLEYGNKDKNTFALRALPDYSELHWEPGPLTPKDGNARYPCFNSKLENVWIIGELRGFRTKDYKFKPHIYNANRVVVGAVPFQRLNRYLAQKTLGFFAMPPTYVGVSITLADPYGCTSCTPTLGYLSTTALLKKSAAGRQPPSNKFWRSCRHQHVTYLFNLCLLASRHLFDLDHIPSSLCFPSTLVESLESHSYIASE